MSEADPVLITDGDGNVPTALEVIYDYVKTVCDPDEPVLMAYNVDTPGVVRFLEEDPGVSLHSYGTVVMLEEQVITLTVRSDVGYQSAKNEALRLRYLIGGLNDYTSRGVTVLAAVPTGIRPLGPDDRDREAIEVQFVVTASKSYV